MNIKLFRIVLLFFACLVLFSCTKKSAEAPVAGNPEIKSFVAYFFVPGSTLVKEGSEGFSFRDQYIAPLTGSDAECSHDDSCNSTKEYSLSFTPNFLIETINGRKTVMGADPDAFVDLCDIKAKKVYRVRETGTDGSIYGTVWLSGSTFVVYGMESDEAFVEVYDIKAKTMTSYTVDNTKRKPGAKSDGFLIARYGRQDQL